MTEQRREYLREYRKAYRAEGFGRINDRAYYMRHREAILEKQRIRDCSRKKLRNVCESA